MIDTASLVSDNTIFLRQAENLVRRLTDDLYRNNHNPFFRSGVGRHIRHILGFYACFLAGGNGRVDYDARQREERIETDRDYAAGKIKDIIAALMALPDGMVKDAPIFVKNDEIKERPPESSFSRSTTQRELQFLMSHTIHHFAIIAMILKIQGFDTPTDFGVAPSTLQYEQSTSDG